MKRLASACPLVIRRFASIWSTAAPTERSALRIINSGLSEISSRDGGGGLGEALAEQLSRQTGIAYVPAFTAYPVTGQLVDWVESPGKIGVEVNMPATFSNYRDSR